jgi:hypothetical protein
MKSGVEHLAQHTGWKTEPKPRGFFALTSGSVEYATQWQAWEALCERNGVDADTILDLLNRARKAIR